jgi:hypothetical protein
VKFFFDNNLAPKIAKGLNCFISPDHQAVHLKEWFPAKTDDVEWMQKLAHKENLIIITADVRIGKNPQEVEAWQQAGHTIFFLKPGWTDMQFWDQAQKFTKCFPAIIEKSKTARRGSSFIISANGKIEG